MNIDILNDLPDFDEIRKKNQTLIEGFNFVTEKWEILFLDLIPECELFHIIKLQSGWVNLHQSHLKGY